MAGSTGSKFEGDGRELEPTEILGGGALRPEPPERSGDGSGEWHPGAVLLDDFEVERLLGRGAMGAVYLVRSRSMGVRHAVKRLRRELTRGPMVRRAFLRELVNWSALPLHPHLTQFRFFRTLEGELLIFAEYVAGGALSEWIREGRLCELPQLLDVIFQLALGLHAAHECGVIHQDVKPANVLLTEDGEAKLTDFGLARAGRMRAPEGDMPRPGAEQLRAAGEETLVATSAGMTPLYCSPEQAWGGDVTRASDIWSWGLTALHLFSGKVSWRVGVQAPDALAKYRSQDGSASGPAPMPAELIELLQRCFEQAPERRWPGMAPLLEQLAAIYESSVGRPYGRPAWRRWRAEGPGGGRTTGPTFAFHRGWTEPAAWLGRLRGRPEGDVDGVELPALPGSLSARARAIADLALFEQLVEPLEREHVEPDSGLASSELACFYLDKSRAHAALGDLAGALSTCRRAEALLRAAMGEGHGGAPLELAEALRLDGSLLIKRGEVEAALKVLRCAEEVLQPLSEGRLEQARVAGLLSVLDTRFEALRLARRLDAALETISRAEQLLAGAPDLSGGPLARARAALQRALLQIDLERPESALQHVARAETLLAGPEDDAELRGLRVEILAARALGLRRAGRLDEAIETHRRAVEMLSHAVRVEGRLALAERLGSALNDRAYALQCAGRSTEALADYQRATALLERLVYDEGRLDIRETLGLAMLNQGSLEALCGSVERAIELQERAVEIYERLVLREARDELTSRLTRMRLVLAASYSAAGRHQPAMEHAARALEKLEQLVDQEQRRDLLDALLAAYISTARIHAGGGRPDTAVRLHDRAIRRIREDPEHPTSTRLLDLDGIAHKNKAQALLRLGEIAAAENAAQRAARRFEQLVHELECRELRYELALSRLVLQRARAMRDRGLVDRAVVARELAALEREAERTGRKDIARQRALHEQWFRENVFSGEPGGDDPEATTPVEE